MRARQFWNRFGRACALGGSLLVLLACERARAQEGAPVIEQIEPSSGPPGTVVQIIGRRFASQAKVSLAGVELPLESAQPNRLSVRIPEGAKSGNVAVSGAGGSVRGPEFRVTPPPPPPEVDAIDPAKGPPGTHVAIRGKHFSPRLTGNAVTIGGAPVIVRSALPEQLEVIIPDIQKGGPFVVRVEQAGEATSKASFEVTAATTISELKPARGGPGSELTIRGRGFSKTPKQNRVYLNNVPLTVKNANESELVVQLPEKVASGKLLVDVQGAGRAYSPEPFVVQRPPTIADLTPERGAPGSVLAVRGTNFGTDPAAIEAKLGEVSLLVREARDTSLRLELQAGAESGRLSIRVRGVGPVWSKQTFTVLSPLKIASFMPQSGPAGTEVVIEGQGFAETAAGNRVSVGGESVSVLEASSTRLKIRVPRTRSGPILLAASGNGETRTQAAFVVTKPPAIAKIAPEKGAPGAELTIHGSGFGKNPSLLKVSLGGRPLELRSVRDDAIVARLPPGAQSGRIKVELALQGATESSAEFVVEPASSPATPAPAPLAPSEGALAAPAAAPAKAPAPGKPSSPAGKPAAIAKPAPPAKPASPSTPASPVKPAPP